MFEASERAFGCTTALSEKKMFYELKPILCGGKATEDQHPKIIMV